MEREHSIEYPRFKRLYNEGRLSEVGLQRAVDKGIIWDWEMVEIMTENAEEA